MKKPGFVLSLIRDQRGLSAVEFAMLAPIMILFYFGVAEFCQGFMAQKRVSSANSAIADLVAQAPTVTGAEIDDIFQIGTLILTPFNSSTLNLRVSSVTRNSQGALTVDWSRGRGMPARASNNPPVVPTGLIGNGESLIVAETTYDYDSPVDFMLPAVTRFSRIWYSRPRLVERVSYTP